MVVPKIDHSMKLRLCEVLDKHVPIAQQASGRDVLLEGIPNCSTWYRQRDNSYVDLFEIIKQAEMTFTKDDPPSWGLITLIENAYLTVKDSQAGTILADIRQYCQYCLEQFLLQKTGQQQEGAARSLPRPEEITLESPYEHPLAAFFDIITCYIQAATDNIQNVCQLFPHPFLGGLEPASARRALVELDGSVQQILGLRTFLEQDTLPKQVMSKRHLFTDHIAYLVEQIRQVMTWINDNNGSHQDIAPKLAVIQQKFITFVEIQEKSSEIGGELI